MSSIKSKVLQLIQEQTTADLTETKDLISGGHLDSFAVLMLVSNLESNFSIEFGFDEDIYQALESAEGIESLVLKHLEQPSQERLA